MVSIIHFSPRAFRILNFIWVYQSPSLHFQLLTQKCHLYIPWPFKGNTSKLKYLVVTNPKAAAPQLSFLSLDSLTRKFKDWGSSLFSTLSMTCWACSYTLCISISFPVDSASTHLSLEFFSLVIATKLIFSMFWLYQRFSDPRLCLSHQIFIH